MIKPVLYLLKILLVTVGFFSFFMKLFPLFEILYDYFPKKTEIKIVKKITFEIY